MCFCCVEANAGRFLLQSYCVFDRVGHGVLYISFFCVWHKGLVMRILVLVEF